MSNKLEADVVVVGAGTAGCYFAWQLGKAGYKVLILEARKLDNTSWFSADKIVFSCNLLK